ncbi:hypothetical protein QBC39DRAFT_350708 [Podospora conica]|nr:hypothetical protein QBC39DRAFT_350708 [Schizothecium conicum]
MPQLDRTSGNLTHQPGSPCPPTPHSPVHEQGKGKNMRYQHPTSLDDRNSNPVAIHTSRRSIVWVDRAPSAEHQPVKQSHHPFSNPSPTLTNPHQPSSPAPAKSPPPSPSRPRVFPPPTWMEPLERTLPAPVCAVCVCRETGSPSFPPPQPPFWLKFAAANPTSRLAGQTYPSYTNLLCTKTQASLCVCHVPNTRVPEWAWSIKS